MAAHNKEKSSVANATEREISVGIDVGSTTAKIAMLDADGQLLFGRYLRHRGEPLNILRVFIDEIRQKFAAEQRLHLRITGSAGLGLAEAYGLSFVQEVVASSQYIRQRHPQVRSFIEIGGEDSKVVFFDELGRPDIRMNGSCAGGTGSFIDQMAALLNVDVSEMNALAAQAKETHPVASRCGVFAKTDVQALLARHVSKEDIAASVFHAVALQVITALARGRDIEPAIIFGGGPLTFNPLLQKAFARILKIQDENNFVIVERPELIPAMGAALADDDDEKVWRGSLQSLRDLLAQDKKSARQQAGDKRLPTLFASEQEFQQWQQRHDEARARRLPLQELGDAPVFLGIDSGSTTTKIVLIDAQARLLLGHYAPNNGDPVKSVREGLEKIRAQLEAAGVSPQVLRSAATGYGEGLIQAAFGVDDGVVETMAHYRAARHFEPEVSFIMDIGGQDMKAIYIRDHAVAEIQVNEACSSGCGSFIDTFSQSLGYGVQDFSRIACAPNKPFDLGTRCTVFMNSRVKEALRDQAGVDEISAGLAYSVVKNALYKVLKLTDTAVLGDKIVVQGGTFRNPAVLRALELLLKKEVVRPDIAELMGAFGAALTALQHYQAQDERKKHKSQFTDWAVLQQATDFTQKEIHCKGCENHCTVLKLKFSNGRQFYTGMRCERFFSNDSGGAQRGHNLIEDQLQLLLDQPLEPRAKERKISLKNNGLNKNKPLRFGLPRTLNIYENFPFWATLLTEYGFAVELSDASNFRIYERGAPTVMSENVCFPAKLAHGHIYDLIDKGVDRIFFPTAVYEQVEHKKALNSYNCPIVTGYPDLLRSAIDPQGRHGIPFDSPAISFRDPQRLRDQLFLYFKQFGKHYDCLDEAVEKALAAQRNYQRVLRQKGQALIDEARGKGMDIIVLAGRPYHIDPLINHGIPQLLSALGVAVLSENALPIDDDDELNDVNVLTQWSYTNRLYAAAHWVCRQPDAQLVQLTSFGCGPDSISSDEVASILRRHGKISTLIKMDEISNLGAVRIRLRSLLEAMHERASLQQQRGWESKQAAQASQAQTPLVSRDYVASDRRRTLITPYFSPFYSPLIAAAVRPLGYKIDVLPPQDKASVEYGLKSVNNDMCYPSILVAGDIIKALETGAYKPEDTAVVLTQTGGQCRASAYVSLVKKGLAARGFADVPVVAISGDADINEQPGFDIDQKALVKRMAYGIIFADPLAQMYLSTLPREINKGETKRLHSAFLHKLEAPLVDADFAAMKRVLAEAVQAFNKIPVHNRPVPKVGVVGEIFVKYNFFSHANIIEWLSEQGIEVVLPAIQTFFTQYFVNETYNQRARFKLDLKDRIVSRLAEFYTNFFIDQVENIAKDFRFYRPSHDLRSLAHKSERVVSLANQYGEGWLLTAEMIGMLEDGVGNIVSIQPFGCISNHITSRGVEKSLKKLYPQLNLLSIDMDAGASEVNILNRLHFVVMGARHDGEPPRPKRPANKFGLRFVDPQLWQRSLFDVNNQMNLEFEKWYVWVSKLGLWGRKGKN